MIAQIAESERVDATRELECRFALNAEFEQ